jgi:undecaprenyl phosphate N,N'-diacetylbacillosamine 1-phosphate transferase
MTTAYYQYFKRGVDVFLGIILVGSLSWFILLILLCYLCTWQFPIIFKQLRIGKNEVPFTMYKFRTLSNEDLPLQERRFALGDFLRFTNADELPQLWNVLKGEMSLIGPRPLPLEYASLLTKDQQHRHIVRPGLTGWAQVNGKNSLSWEQKFNFDLAYVKQISFKTDLNILIKTITLVLSMKQDVSLREEKLKG